MKNTYVRDIIREKGAKVWTIPSDATVFNALEKMADKNIGAVVVTEGEDKVVGILSGRDYARKVALRGKVSREIPVSEIMTGDVLCVKPDNTCDDCMQLFTNKRVRHLPVVDDGKLAGIVSIGDVVRKIMAEQQAALTDLENFITGAGYGA